MRLLVALETHFDRDRAGRVVSRYGTDAYGFWQRYLEVFDEVLVAARTSAGPAPPDDAAGARDDTSLPVEGPRVRVVPLPDYRGPWGYLLQRRRLFGMLRGAVAGADALCLRAPGAIAAAAWRVRAGRPYAVEMVGDPDAALAPGSVRSVARPLARRALVRSARALCAGAVAVAYVREHELPERYPTRGWHTSYSSLDLPDDAFASVERLARRAHECAALDKGSARNPWRLVCVASLAQPYKGQDTLIDALARCRERGLALTLVLVGDGVRRPALAAAARARGVDAAVTFAGHVAPTAVGAFVDAADLFVLPSRTEGLPRALIEAMARGVPAIGSDAGGIAELLPADRRVPAADAEALARALLRWCSPATDFASLARRDRDVARRHAARLLRPRRRALYRRLRHAAELRHAPAAIAPPGEPALVLGACR